MTITRLDDRRPAATLADDVRAGLRATPKFLPSKYFYDRVGSELFEQITQLPEYYPTRTERAILAARAGEIARLSRAETLVEIGSGTSEKTRLLLSALRQAGTLRRFVPFDVDPSVLARAGETIARDFAPIEVEALVGDFEQHTALLPRHPRRLVAFLGSTIGNLEAGDRARFLQAVSATLADEDAFLMGTDLVRDPDRLRAAYDDPGGVTARFNKNVLAVLNRELGANFDLDDFDHVAEWNAAQGWMEMRLRARRAVTVSVAVLGLDVGFAAGEEIRTEISVKFTPDQVRDELAAAGLSLVHWWTDEAGDFALSLARSAATSPPTPRPDRPDADPPAPG